MRFVLVLLAATRLAVAHQAPPPAPLPPQEPTVDPAKLAIIQQIATLQKSGSATLQVVSQTATFVPRTSGHPLPPGQNAGFQAAIQKKVQSLDYAALIAPAYASAFSLAELRDLLAFYRSPLGQKVLVQSPALERQIVNRAQVLGHQIGAAALEEVTQSHPDDTEPTYQSTHPLVSNGGRIEAGLSSVPPPPPPPATPYPPRNAPLRIAGQVAEANILEKVDPVYPPLALSAHVSGTVEFTTFISKEGNIQNLQLVRGHPLLVNAAKEAVLQWKYRPTLVNGTPVDVVTSVIVTFTLPQ